MSSAATERLIDQDIKVRDIDQWGWDLLLRYQIKQANAHNNPQEFWAALRIGIDKE